MKRSSACIPRPQMPQRGRMKDCIQELDGPGLEKDDSLKFGVGCSEGPGGPGGPEGSECSKSSKGSEGEESSEVSEGSEGSEGSEAKGICECAEPGGLEDSKGREGVRRRQ